MFRSAEIVKRAIVHACLNLSPNVVRGLALSVQIVEDDPEFVRVQELVQWGAVRNLVVHTVDRAATVGSKTHLAF